MKPVFPYVGAKTSLARRIIALLPEHRHYVEPYAGSLAVLLAKPASQAETVNDVNGDLMRFWRVLRDRPDELIRACALTPHSHAEYYQAHEPLDDLDDVEAARRIWVRLTQGASRTTRHQMWAKYVTYTAGAKPYPAQIRVYAERLADAAARLADVSLDQRPAVACITKYGRDPNTVLYIDPPYMDRPDRYGTDMTTADHTQLLDTVTAARAAVILSGYPSTLYDQALDGWDRVEIPARAGGRGAPNVARTEVLWHRGPRC